MTKQSETQKLAAKKREWDIASRDFDRAWGKVVKEIKLDTKNMIKWLLCYKPDSTADMVLHVIEVFGVWFMITKTLLGLW